MVAPLGCPVHWPRAHQTRIFWSNVLGASLGHLKGAPVLNGPCLLPLNIASPVLASRSGTVLLRRQLVRRTQLGVIVGRPLRRTWKNGPRVDSDG